MNDFAEYAPRYFDFISERFGFRRTVLSPSHLRYENGTLYFDVTINWRDGPQVDFGRINQPGIVPGHPHESISLATLLGAIETSLGTYKQWARPPEQDFAALSAGLVQYAKALISADAELYRQLRELAFWHVGPWTRTWGKTIIMSPEEIARNRKLVPDIIRLIRMKDA